MSAETHTRTCTIHTLVYTCAHTYTYYRMYTSELRDKHIVLSFDRNSPHRGNLSQKLKCTYVVSSKIMLIHLKMMETTKKK